MKAPITAKPSSWEQFFGKDVVLTLSQEELHDLNREYALFPPPLSEKSHLLPEGLEDDDENYSQDSEEFQSSTLSLPLCCEKQCLSLLNARDIAERQWWLKQMNKREQDIAILSLLVSGKRSDKEIADKSSRTRFSYRFDYQHELCRDAFLFIYGIKEARLKRLQKLAASNTLLPSVHGNTHHIPIHALPATAVNGVVDFISNYAAIHGLPDPGRLRRNTREVLLPRSDTYISVWQLYKEGLRESRPEVKMVGYDSFRMIWKHALPHIKFQGPRSDLCDLCDELKTSMKWATSHEQLQQIMTAYENHYHQADVARTYYHQQIQEAEQSWLALSAKTRARIMSHLSTMGRSQVQPACSRNLKMHYAFDFAQQVFYPYSNQQRGKAFFKVARKCHIFGVCAEPLPRQVFFLIDESEIIGKGSRVVISLLDAFFRLHGLGEREASLHADNCTGQNKNNYVIWYLMWRVMNGLHRRIHLSFMVPGHTKFAPDRYFGLFKIRYRRSTIDDLEDVVRCVNECTTDSKAVAQVYGEHLGLPKEFEYRCWDSYLATYFKPVDSLLNYNYFGFDAAKPGCIELRVAPDDIPLEVNILKRKHTRFASEIEPPKEILPEGLTLERETYLYKEIRGFVRNPKKRDRTCPYPSSS
jgi:hypothetical protein